MKWILRALIVAGLTLPGTAADSLTAFRISTSTEAYNYPVKVTVTNSMVHDFDRMRFYYQTTPLNHWIESSTASSAEVWVRIPHLSKGTTRIVLVESDLDYAPVTYATPLTATIDRATPYESASPTEQLTLPTTVKTGYTEVSTPMSLIACNGGQNVKGVHPHVVQAQGWMTKATEGGEAVYDRVLVDTPFGATAHLPAPYSAQTVESGCLWLRKVSDGSWVVPPVLTAFQPEPVWTAKGSPLSGTLTKGVQHIMQFVPANAGAGDTFRLTVNVTAVDYVCDANPTIAEICAGLVAAWAGCGGDCTGLTAYNKGSWVEVRTANILTTFATTITPSTIDGDANDIQTLTKQPMVTALLGSDNYFFPMVLGRDIVVGDGGAIGTFPIVRFGTDWNPTGGSSHQPTDGVPVSLNAVYVLDDEGDAVGDWSLDPEDFSITDAATTNRLWDSFIYNAGAGTMSANTQPDPTSLWITHDTIPEYDGDGDAGPAKDTLMVLWCGTTAARKWHYRMLTSAAHDAWDDVAIANTVDIEFDAEGGPQMPDPVGASWDMQVVSPAIIQNSDGTWTFFGGCNYAASNIVRLCRWDAEWVDGTLTWGDPQLCSVEIPPGLAGPWHFDVQYLGGQYFLVGGYGALGQIGSGMSGQMLMHRSWDGLTFRLEGSMLNSTPAETSLNWMYSGWFYNGVYRPSMCYISGTGMEFYVSGHGNVDWGYIGGVGGWLDSSWTPTVPQTVAEPITQVFPLFARDFNNEYNVAPNPMAFQIKEGYAGTGGVSGGVMTMDVPARTSTIRWARRSFPANYELTTRVQVKTGGIKNLLVVGPNIYYGLQLGDTYKATKEAAYTWGAYDNPVLYADLTSGTGWHTVRIRRISNMTSVWVDDVRLTTDGAAYNGSNGEADTSATPTSDADYVAYTLWAGWSAADIDWVFVRDAMATEPTATAWTWKVPVQPIIEW